MVLTDKITEVTGTPQFFNSGIILTQSLARDRLDFVDFGKGFNELVKPGQRMNPTLLNMPSGSLSLPPHCHPGGEIAYLIDGEYFDADMSGKPIKSYTPGSIVVYGAFSTHRPLSKTGARIFYVPLDGILFPGKSPDLQADDMINLLRKMESAGAPPQALDYARSWML